MVKFKLNILKQPTSIELVDDAEGTPGASRQYTRFRQNIADFEQAWNNTIGYSVELAGKTLAKSLSSCNFKVTDIKETDEKGIVLFFAESTEP